MEEYNNAKVRIQNSFFQQHGLHVDKPRAKFGNSNDGKMTFSICLTLGFFNLNTISLLLSTGNTARRFFKNAEISSQIAGIDLDLIIRLRTILQAILSGESVDPQKFDQYSKETAKRYVSLYSWDNMPTTLLKLLIHGYQIINNALLPIGRISEEAKEAINK